MVSLVRDGERQRKEEERRDKEKAKTVYYPLRTQLGKVRCFLSFLLSMVAFCLFFGFSGMQFVCLLDMGDVLDVGFHLLVDCNRPLLVVHH